MYICMHLSVLYIEKILYIEVAVSVQKNIRIADITPLCICVFVVEICLFVVICFGKVV